MRNRYMQYNISLIVMDNILLVVGVGWSGYFKTFFEVAFNVHFGDSWTTPPIYWNEDPAYIAYSEGSYFNVPGFVIILLVTILLCVG